MNEEFKLDEIGYWSEITFTNPSEQKKKNGKSI